MLKVNKKSVCPVYMNTLRAGDTFLYEGVVYMMVNMNGTPRPVNLERGNWATNIHSDAKVMPCNCELTVLS